jgi:hypothetical protein
LRVRAIVGTSVSCCLSDFGLFFRLIMALPWRQNRMAARQMWLDPQSHKSVAQRPGGRTSRFNVSRAIATNGRRARPRNAIMSRSRQLWSNLAEKLRRNTYNHKKQLRAKCHLSTRDIIATIVAIPKMFARI